MSSIDLNQSIEAALDTFCESIQTAYSKRVREVLFRRLESNSKLGGLYPTRNGELSFVVDDLDGELLSESDMRGDNRLILPLELLVTELQERIAAQRNAEGCDDFAQLAARMRATADALDALIRDNQP